MGGLEVMKDRNEEKAKILYDFLDQSKMFKGTVVKEDRSLMNVPFVTGNDDLDAKFVKEAKELIDNGNVGGGMIPKLQNCIDAIEEGVSRVHILDGRIPHCLLLEIFTNKGIGTAILRKDEIKDYDVQ